jgi:CBS domain-containing protein
MDLTTRDVMRSHVKTVRPDLTLPDLEREFGNQKVNGFAVVDEGTLLGVVSRADVLRRLCDERSTAETASGFYEDGSGIDAPLPAPTWISETVGKHLDHLRVSDVMARQLITVSPSQPLREAARVMQQHGIHRILVTDDRRLVGVISSFDFVRLYASGRIGVPRMEPDA